MNMRNADLGGRIEVPSITASGTVTPKWTIRNDEWVQVMVAIQRGPNGQITREMDLSGRKK